MGGCPVVPHCGFPFGTEHLLMFVGGSFSPFLKCLLEFLKIFYMVYIQLLN